MEGDPLLGKAEQSASPGRGFPRTARIRQKKEFDRVFAEARFLRLRHFTAVVAPVEAGESRLGLVVSAKTAKRAVRRNRIRRRLRSVFRLNRSGLAGEWDVVLIGRLSAADCPWRELESAFAKLVRELNKTPAGREDAEGR